MLNAARMCSVVKVTFGQSLPSPREFQTFIRESNVLHHSKNTLPVICPSKGVGHRDAHLFGIRYEGKINVNRKDDIDRKEAR